LDKICRNTAAFFGFERREVLAGRPQIFYTRQQTKFKTANQFWFYWFRLVIQQENFHKVNPN